MPHFLTRIVVVAAVALSLGACASRDLSYTEAQALMPAKSADKGRIYFYREASWLGNSITPDIVMNGKVVGSSNPGAFFFLDRDPGEYAIFCGKGEHNNTHVTLAAGQEVYVRTAVAGGIVKAEMEADVEPPQLALPQIHKLNLYNTASDTQ